MEHARCHLSTFGCIHLEVTPPSPIESKGSGKRVWSGTLEIRGWELRELSTAEQFSSASHGGPCEDKFLNWGTNACTYIPNVDSGQLRHQAKAEGT